MTFAYLDDPELREVQRAAIELGFADDGQLSALAAGISPAFVAAWTQGGNAPARLLTLTTRMNTTRVLVSGEVPLTKWLNNAILMAAGMPQEMVFRKALEQASVDQELDPIRPSGQRPPGKKLLIVEDEIGETIVDVLEEEGYECTLITSYAAWKKLRDKGLVGFDGALVDLHLHSRDDAMGMHIIKYLRDSTEIPTAMVTTNPQHTRHHDKHQMLAEYRLVDLVDKDDRERYLQDLPATARLLVGTDDESCRHRLATWVEAAVCRVTRETAESGSDQVAQDRLRECREAAQRAQDTIRFGSLNEAQRQVDTLCRQFVRQHR